MNVTVLTSVTYHGTQYNAGEMLEMDTISANNLARKGRVAAATDTAGPSMAVPEMAPANSQPPLSSEVVPKRRGRPPKIRE